MEYLEEEIKKSEKNQPKTEPNNNSEPNPKTNDETSPKKEGTKWGYDLYPERRGTFKPGFIATIIAQEGRETTEKIKCERNVYNCVMKSPLVQLMMGALKSSGCEIDIRRHFSCEVCDRSVTGGYDPQLNQIVICQNNTTEGTVQGILTHEMIHMFDYCNNKLDFTNIDHLACTEIRAANLAHCSFLSAMAQGDASPINIKQRHQDCVKSKAMYSVMAARKVTMAEAISAVERTFPRCYADLEPIGRRIKRNSSDWHRAYNEARLYGYK